MQILITGAAGFVGSNLALELRRQDPSLRIWGLDNLSRKGSEGNVPRLQSAGVEFIPGDIRDAALLDTLPAVDWVIDCAANPSVLAGVDGKSTSFEVMDHNLIGTLRLLEYCKRHRSGFLLLSTSRVYSIAALAGLPVEAVDGAVRLRQGAGSGEHGAGSRERGAWKMEQGAWSEEQGVGSGERGAWSMELGDGRLPAVSPAGVTEDFPTTPPLSLYGMSKRCSEDLALEYGASFGFPVWINRCGVLAGAGQFGRADQGIFAYWINAWLRGRPLKYIGFEGSGYQVRDALHPRDLVSLILKQMAEPQRPVERIQNLSGGRAHSMSLQQLSAWCDRRFGPRKVEQDLKARPYDIPWLVLDSSRALAQWGWRPATPLAEILEEIARHSELHPDWLELSGA